jgi:hypothetical protein
MTFKGKVLEDGETLDDLKKSLEKDEQFTVFYEIRVDDK